MRNQLCRLLAAAILLMLMPRPSAHGQSADALIDKLVEKGILTVKEANALREEADKNFNQAYSVKSGMPDWVNSLKISGDFRARYEGFYSDSQFINPGTTNRYGFQDRNRFRFRLRFGATVTMFEDLEAGFRLTSGEPVGSFGGNEVSGNQTFKFDGSKKSIWIDQAYGKWSPLKGPDWTGNFAFGKMENPFTVDDMVFDPNYTPEGADFQLAYAFTDRQSLKMTVGAFALNDVPNFNGDPYFAAAQLRWDATWSPKLASTMGVAGYFLQNTTNLDNAAVPNIHAGNTRNVFGGLTNDYYPLVVDAALTYTLESFPFYQGAFPLRFGGEYMYNLAAKSGSPTDYYAWNLGVTLGKAGKRGTWEFGYSYRWLGADAWYEELPDDDFGAIYWQTPAEWASGTTFPGFNVTPVAPAPPHPPNPNNSYYIPGTNVKGHVVRFAYSPTDALTFSLKCLLTELIRPYPTKSDSQVTRLQVDATLRF